MESIHYDHSGYHFTSDKSRMQWDVIHHWLTHESYWAKGIPLDKVKSAGDHSFTIGIFRSERQVGYARIVTDYTSFGYLADVFIIPEHRQKGLSKVLLRCIFDLDWVQELRRFLLCTHDAQGLYQKFGFAPLSHPERFLQIHTPIPYDNKK